ncbi:alpha-L-fucosidase [Saccharopolyspora erythraea]|uniref:alpha-L-fucosidase n=1 Tax=Saccharopolyspora erythraea TaxID=1836 RepID=UPI001BAD5BCC|nr:alpha-L-fucosidase [Saccharopolyspora erythraea]QUH00767.1 alpha-L-fucosidase [Saccharopolyspora erythraea]
MAIAARRLWRLLLAVGGTVALTAGVPAQAETAPPGPGTNFAVDDVFTSARTQWWRDARFGMFIHHGAYSQLEGEYTRPDGTVCRNAEWIQRECAIPKDEYERIAAKFNPAEFDADAIAATAKAAGQQYVVMTAKHHEGYAMWPTEVNDYNLRDHSAFDPERDILAELEDATEREGVKLGFYYSIWDWHDPDAHDPATFPRYKQRMFAQLRELVENYHPAVLWFDGEWDTDNPFNPWTARDGEELEAFVRGLDPDIVINNRVGKRRVTDGDTGTPEQEIPAEEVRGQLWESCMTLNDHWGFARYDQNWKSPADLTRNLAAIAGRGGNYLLNVGPDSAGRVPPESVDRLRQVGEWLRTNGSAVRGAGVPGVVAEPAWGAVSRTGDELHASVFQWPGAGNSLELKATAPFEVTGARVLGSDQRVDAVRDGDTVRITPSGDPVGDAATVVELDIRPRQPTPEPRGTGLTARFWDNPDFAGEPVVTRTDPGVDYNWKYSGSPDAAVPSEGFSARWTGTVEPRFSEDYEITTVSDDTVRLWIDDRLVIDGTTPHEGAVDSAKVRLEAGRRHAIRLEQTERGGEAAMKLLWSSPNTSQRIIPAGQLFPPG